MDTHAKGCINWLLILLLTFNMDVTIGRPSSELETNLGHVELMKQSSTPSNSDKIVESIIDNKDSPAISNSNLSREEKSNNTAIGESIKMVASQLLQGNRNPPEPSSTGENRQVADVRTPPKVKNQTNKIKPKTPTTTPIATTTTTTTSRPKLENSHAGIAVPMNSDDLEKELFDTTKTKINTSTSTTKEGLSTWILLSGSPTTSSPPKVNIRPVEENSSKEDSKETTKVTYKQKAKPTNKPNRQVTVTPKPIFTRRPITIASQNKADLVASGSAVNENVMNKIKASVLASVQKNKNAALKTTTTTTTTIAPATKATTVVNKDTNEIVVSFESETTTKRNENKNKNKKNKTTTAATTTTTTTTTEKSVEDVNNSIESKIAEIELEVSTPQPVKTKKRTQTKRKKNKNRRRKPVSSTSKPDVEIAETKITTNTATNPATKIASKVPPKEKPITTQIYNYLSREVMPSVGVGLVSLAGIVGLASYFLYPFSNVVRRAYDINDRNDENLYYQNGEVYASNDGGKSEIEMLGEVLDGMPDKPTDQNLTPYSANISPTQFRYPQTHAEQTLKYRNVNIPDSNYVSSNRVGQHSLESMKGSAYSESIHYDTHSSDAHQYQYQPQLQPVYKGSDNVILETSYSEPTHSGYVVNEKMMEPVYGQPMNYNQDMNIDTTKEPTIETLHLGSDDIIEKQKETGYTVASVGMEDKQPQFVVGNIPKELIKAPITVPEHGPRSLRKRRNAEQVKMLKGRSIIDPIDKHIRISRDDPEDPDMSNEIDSKLGVASFESIQKMIEQSSTNKPDVKPTNMVSIEEIGNVLTTTKNMEADIADNKSKNDDKNKSEKIVVNNKNVTMKESLQIEIKTTQAPTESIPHEFIEVTTKEENNEVYTPETTTEYKIENTSEPHYTDNDYGDGEPVYNNKISILGFIKSLIQFKIRVGMSLLQTATEGIARYLRGVESSLNTAAKASEYARQIKHDTN